MNRFRIFIFLISMSFSFQAQKKWTLNECVDYALNHNLELKNNNYIQKSNKESYKQSIRDLLLPELSAKTDYGISYGRSVDPNNNSIVNSDFFSNNYSLSSSLNLFQGFKKLNLVRASKLIYKATEQETLQQKYMLAFNVMGAFYEIQFAENLLSVAQENKEITQGFLKLVTKKFDLGLASAADVLETETTLLTDQLAITQQKNALSVSKLRLAQIMNLERATTIEIQSTIDQFKNNKEDKEQVLDSIFEVATAFVPQIRAATLNVEAVKRRIQSVRGNLFPSLSLSAGVQTGYYETNIDPITRNTISFNRQIKDQISQFVGVSLFIPISDRWTVRSAIKQQKINLDQADNQLQIEKNALYQLLQELTNERTLLNAEGKLNTKNVAAQGQLFEIAQKKYDNGLFSTFEVFQTKNQLAEAKNKKLLVQQKLKINKKTLEFYKGIQVFENSKFQ